MTTPAAPPAAEQPATTPPAGNARVMFSPAQMETRVGSPITVSVLLDNGTDVASAPMQIQFDPKVLRLNDISSGDFLAQGGVQPVFAKNIQNDAGTATVQLSRAPGSPGVSGAGVLITLNFQVVAKGDTTVTVTNAGLRNSQNQTIGGGNPGLPVRIQ